LILFTPKLQAQRTCGSEHDLEELKRNNPKAYQEYLKIQKHTDAYIKKMKSGNSAFRLIDENGTIIIPVVVHIIHRPGEAVGAGSNLSVAQIQSQIDVLNEDFNRQNADQSNTRAEWIGVAGTPLFEFRLACIDPNGLGTNGITRRASPTATTVFTQESDNIKFTNQGGQNAWPTERYLNIWVALNVISTQFGPLLGYAQFPRDYSSSPNTDGVVVVSNAFGRGFSGLNPQFNLGRTLTHEVGHWLNVFHTFEGGSCSGVGDECADTPPQSRFNLGCPGALPRSCSSTVVDMFQNFMDYSDDACMNLFTQDQTLRMRAVFQSGGVRRGFIDNYFNLTAAQPEFDCGDGGPIHVRTPFCANGAVTWTHTGAIAPYLPSSNVSSPIYQVIGDGEATITASWENYTDTETFVVGRGVNKGTFFNPNVGYEVVIAPNTPQLVPSNRTMTLTVTNTVASGTPSVSVSNTPSNFQWWQSGNIIQFRFARVLPAVFNSVTFNVTNSTNCGDITTSFIFNNLSAGYQYRLSPNPATTNLIVNGTASNLVDSDNSRVAQNFTYDIEIINQMNQLVKRVKNLNSGQESDIDISGLARNQFYTIRFINKAEVTVQKFFKG
jgi:hypothetical protein